MSLFTQTNYIWDWGYARDFVLACFPWIYNVIIIIVPVKYYRIHVEAMCHSQVDNDTEKPLFVKIIVSAIFWKRV